MFTAQEKAQITELAARLRDASKELNWIKRSSDKHSLLNQAQITKLIVEDIERLARS